MSYILDALKKADSERQHGKAPNIYSNQSSSNTLEQEESSWHKPVVWILVAVVIALLAVILLFNSWPRPQPAVIVVPAQATPAPATPAAPASPATQNVPAVPIQVAASAQPAQSSAPSVAIPAAPAEPVKLQPSPQLSTAVAKEKHEKHREHTAVSASHVTKKDESAKDADLAIETVSTTLRDLPLNIQNEIPTVTVGGYIYSSKKEDCQLLINKQLLREGEQVAPGLKLERMMPHSAILNYKGYRYRISY
jgi:general secretion pathway protein B